MNILSHLLHHQEEENSNGAIWDTAFSGLTVFLCRTLISGGKKEANAVQRRCNTTSASDVCRGSGLHICCNEFTLLQDYWRLGLRWPIHNHGARELIVHIKCSNFWDSQENAYHPTAELTVPEMNIISNYVTFTLVVHYFP